MAQCLLHPERKEDDAEDHRHVQVRVQVAREVRALGTLRISEPGLRDEGDPIEVGPPQGRRDDHPQQGGRDPRGIERQSCRADADRDDRLSQGDDDDESVSLDEVRWRDVPPPPTADQRAEVVDRQGGDPQPELDRPVEEAGDHEQCRPEERAGRPSEDGAAELRIVAAGDHEQDEVQDADEEIGDTEDEGLCTECLGRREGHDQHGRRRGEYG